MGFIAGKNFLTECIGAGILLYYKLKHAIKLF